MLDKFLFSVKRLIPLPIFVFFQPAYHWGLAFLAAIFYGFSARGGSALGRPSRSMKVVGITGTSGKTTTCEMLFKIFEEAGFKVAAMDGLYFRILEKTEPNLLKMTMPGRFRIQKFLREAKRARCEYVFLEVTSEGLKQFRHKFIKFYAAILTNLFEEHLEAHGGFDNYRAAKAELFKIAPIHVLNGDDPNFNYFAEVTSREKIIFKSSDWPPHLELKLSGDFNKMNAIAALTFAKREGITYDISKKALEKIEVLPGRMEFVETGREFRVLVDYAFLPQTLRKVYETLRPPVGKTSDVFRDSTSDVEETGERLICVLGACGGGRDKWKRPVLGDVAAQFCKKVFVTNEDPYDEDPLQIMNEVAGTHNFEKILDRREAIHEALKSAQAGDIIVITGKGAEPWIMGPRGSKIPWDDRRVVKEELEKL